MNRAFSKFASLLLLALSVLVPAAGQGPETGAELSAVLNAPGSLQARLRFEHLTTADGLSNDSVFSILQDHRGFMWFGTQGGLNRYDGYRITQYRHDPKNPHSLGDDFIQMLFEDSRGGIWSGRSFLSRFDPGTETFTRYPLPFDGAPASEKRGIWGLAEDRNGFMWVGVTIGRSLYRLDPRSATFRSYDISREIPKEVADAGIGALHFGADGILWVGTSHGLVRFDTAAGTGIRYFLVPPAPIQGIASDPSGKLWLATSAGAPNMFDPATRTFTRSWNLAPRPDLVGTDMNLTTYPDPGGTILLGTMEGLKILDPRSGAMGLLRNDPADRYSLSGNEIWSIARDREGNLWVGAKGGGVNRLSPGSTAFGAWRHDPGDPASLSDNNVRAITGDSEGNVWIGTYDGGLNRFEPASGKFVHYRHDPRNPRSLDHDRVYSIYEDRSGTLWVGTGLGINRLDRKSGTFEHFWRGPEPPTQLAPLYYFLEDRSDRFWFGGGGLLDRNTGVAAIVGNPGGLSIHEDRHGGLWFASLGALERMDAGGRLRKVPISPSPGAGGPEPVQVNFFHEDAGGMLWLATETGLVRLDPKTEKYNRYTTEQGLPDNVVQCILPDQAGNLWISTNNGITKFNSQDNSFYNYHESDGLQGEAFNRKACYQDPQGRMYFGGLHGFNAFDPRKIPASQPPPPPLVLTEFQIQGRTVPVRPGSVLPRPIWEMDHINLSYLENGFSFEFAALSYVTPARTRYRFKLEGLETEWNAVDSRHRYARYTDLQPGQYTFRVQASTDGRTWSEKGTSLGLSITPPWWMTPWSRAVAILAVAGLIFGSVRWRVMALQERERRLQTLVEQRTTELVEARDQAQAASRTKSTFLANMSHELRTPLNAILGFSSLLRDGGGISREQRNDLDIIHRSGEHLLELITDVLDVAKIEAGRMVVENAACDLRRLARDITEMMQGRAAEKGLKLLVDESPGFPHVARTDASRLRQILINLLGNAVKFTEQGTVTLRLDGLPDVASNRVLLRFEVEDTGIGIPAEDQAHIFDPFVQLGRQGNRKGTGLGLTISRQFVELLGGTIRLESAPGQGSRFCVEVPVERMEESEALLPDDDRAPVVRIAPGQPEYRILVVEDEVENRVLMRRILKDAGFLVCVAADGAEGVAMFQSWRPHFIWMDRRMPIMDGPDAVRRIRELEGGRDVKIAAVTASVLAGQRNEMLAAGMDDFVRKPYRLADIFDCMARHLGVRYVYAEDGARPAAQARPALRPEALAALAEGLRQELENALPSLDAERIAEVIRRISEVDPALGGMLATLAGRFAYTSILRALQAGNGKAGSRVV